MWVDEDLNTGMLSSLRWYSGVSQNIFTRKLLFYHLSLATNTVSSFPLFTFQRASAKNPSLGEQSRPVILLMEKTVLTKALTLANTPASRVLFPQEDTLLGTSVLLALKKN